MGTHVFIVNEKTFPIHLQHLLAGTGAYSQKKKDWLNEHIGLLSDIKRVRAEDFVIFYIEAKKQKKGGFYGIFKIANQSPIVFHTPRASGFRPNLPKNKLIYRTLLEPHEIYAEGVPELEALDKLPCYATEIQWSLIYRKLKGKRGCTPLLPWEAQKLMDMIRSKNSGNPIANNRFLGGFDWDKTNRKIITTSSRRSYTCPRSFTFNVLNSICRLYKKEERYETNLQLYFTENIGIAHSLNQIVGNNIMWFGNEVRCGVGMQSMDILTIYQDGKRKEYRIIELKDEAVRPNIVNQIEYYVNWASQDFGRHLDGAFNWNIQPVIVAPKVRLKTWPKVVTDFKNFNRKQISLPILYFEFKITRNNIQFNQVRY